MKSGKSLASRVLLVLSGLAVGLAIAWLLLPRFVTPDQAAEDRTPPEPDPVTALVEEGVLREVIQVEGVVQPRTSLGVVAPNPEGAQRAVVTYLPDPGAHIEVGQVVVGLSGRPLIFVGQHPNLYRDLYLGLEGADVAGLQRLLAELGHLDDEFEEGVFDVATEDAVERLYTHLGYSPAEPRVVVTEDQILMARNNVDQAEQALRSAREGGDQTSINIATRNRQMARAHLDALLSAPRLALPATETIGLPHRVLVVVGSATTVGAVVDVGSPVLEVRTLGAVVVSTTPRLRGTTVVAGDTVVVQGPAGPVEVTVEQILPAPNDPTQIQMTLGWGFDDAVTGERLVVEVETGVSDGSVVSVPLSAVRTGGDGVSYVTVLENGVSRRVDVQVGVALGGRIAVVGEIRVGDRVIVGRR